MAATGESHEKTVRESHLSEPTGSKPKKLDAKHVGGGDTQQKIDQPMQGKITDHIKQYDGQNSSGSSPKQLPFMDKLLKMGNSGEASVADILGGALMSQIQSDNAQTANNQCPDGWFWNPDANNFNGACQLECPQGQIFDVILQKCVIDTSDSVYKVNTMGPDSDLTTHTTTVPPTILPGIVSNTAMWANLQVVFGPWANTLYKP